MKPISKFSPETLRDLERHCDELFATYHRAKEEAKVLEQRARAARREFARMQGETLSALLRGNEPSPNAKKIHKAVLAERGKYERNRAKFRGRANQIRRRAETILAVLEWAAPDKGREERLRQIWLAAAKPMRAGNKRMMTRGAARTTQVN